MTWPVGWDMPDGLSLEPRKLTPQDAEVIRLVEDLKAAGFHRDPTLEIVVSIPDAPPERPLMTMTFYGHRLVPGPYGVTLRLKD